jgi:threonine dehydrogenase-like Zn-dependent dehydrogenase
VAEIPAVLLDRDRKIILGPRPQPEPQAGRVIVNVDLCGICGSDLRATGLPQVYRGAW